MNIFEKFDQLKQMREDVRKLNEKDMQKPEWQAELQKAKAEFNNQGYKEII